jgi:hypothetical protein
MPNEYYFNIVFLTRENNKYLLVEGDIINKLILMKHNLKMFIHSFFF